MIATFFITLIATIIANITSAFAVLKITAWIAKRTELKKELSNKVYSGDMKGYSSEGVNAIINGDNVTVDGSVENLNPKEQKFSDLDYILQFASRSMSHNKDSILREATKALEKALDRQEELEEQVRQLSKKEPAFKD